MHALLGCKIREFAETYQKIKLEINPCTLAFDSSNCIVLNFVHPKFQPSSPKNKKVIHTQTSDTY